MSKLLNADAARDEPPETLVHLRNTARPIIIRSGIPEFPVSVYGSCCVVGYRQRVFAVTAAHLVSRNVSNDIIVGAADDLHSRLQLGAGITIAPPSDPDSVDVIVYPASLSGLPKAAIERARIIDLPPRAADWRRTAEVSDFWVVGYPRPLNYVDFDAGSIKTAQVVLGGKYEGLSRADGYMHRLTVGNPHELSEFAGFSGAPVFSFHHQVAADSVLRFCGIAITGSAKSGIVQFLDVRAVREVLDTAVDRLEGRLEHPGPPPEEFS